MPENNDKLKTLTQAGAVGISILLILLLWQIFDKGFDVFVNMANLQTTVIQDNTGAMTKLIELLENPRTSSTIADLLPDYLTFK